MKTDKCHKVSAKVFNTAKKKQMLLTCFTDKYTACGKIAYLVTSKWKNTTCKFCLKARPTPRRE